MSETHFTERNYVKIPTYSKYVTNQPEGTAHAGSAIIIRKDFMSGQIINGPHSDNE
jgi:hypothetical protein